MAKAYKVGPQGESAEHHASGSEPADAIEAPGALKAIRASLDDKDITGAKAALSKTVSIVDKMATKGIIHRNTAGRYKSRLASRVQKAGA